MSGPVESQRRSESDRVIVFAHRGAPAPGVPPNSIAAVAAALRAGANAIESDIQLTADGVPVLAHRVVGAGKPIRRNLRADLDDNYPTLADLWERCGVDFDLALDMADPRAAPAIVALARRYGALERLWLTYWRLPLLRRWRALWPEVRLIYSTLALAPFLRGTAARAVSAGVDAINLHRWLLGARTAATVHAAGLRLFVWGLRTDAHVQHALKLGADGVFVDRVPDRAAFRRETGRDALAVRTGHQGCGVAASNEAVGSMDVSVCGAEQSRQRYVEPSG